MRQWEIYDFPYPTEEQPHPFVIISPQFALDSERLATLNALMCVSLRGADQLKPYDVRLNGEDGLDGATRVRCFHFFEFSKEKAGRKRGEVCRARRRQIVLKIKESHGLSI